MRVRQKGQQFATADRESACAKGAARRRGPVRETVADRCSAVEAYLIAFGDDMQPLPETVKVLDEIVTE